MGPDLGPAYHTLSQDVTMAFAKRALFEHLYGQPERLRILVDVAGGFFQVLRHTLLLDLILLAARLVDRADTTGRANLTIRALPPLIADQALRSEVETVVSNVCSDCSDLTDWRNRRLGHRDLAVALGTPDAPLPDIHITDIDKALAGFANILNRLQAHYENGATTLYDSVQGLSADGLFYFLKRGLDAEAEDVEL
jgi:hypothetical protein